MKAKRDFWVFSYAKGAGSARGEEARWGIDSNLPVEITNDFKRQVGPVSVPAEPYVASAERGDRIEDVPWVYQDFYVVSDRVRRIFDEYSPGDCQFLPIDIRIKGRSLRLPYWILHCLHTIDCADPDKSYRVDNPDLYYVSATVLPEKVPPNTCTFRIAHSAPWPVVRESLRRIIVKNKITGCMFYAP